MSSEPSIRALRTTDSQQRRTVIDEQCAGLLLLGKYTTSQVLNLYPVHRDGYEKGMDDQRSVCRCVSNVHRCLLYKIQELDN